MAVFKVNVKTDADTKGIQQTQKGLAGLEEQAGKSASLMSRFIGGVTSLFNKLNVSIAAASVAILGAKRALQEFGEAEQGIFRLDAAFRQVGALTQKNREEAQELAGAYQKLTGIADDEWVAAMARMVQFGADPARMNEYLEIVKNAAGLFDGDVRQATEAVTRAMGGNYEAFSRLGLQIAETADEGKKWKSLVSEVARVGGGQLEAMASGSLGSWRQLQNAINDTFESIGRLIVIGTPAQTVLGTVKSGAEKLANALGGTIVDKAAAMENIFQRTVTPLEQNAAAANKFAKALEAIDKAAKKVSQTLSDEEEAFQLIKESEDAKAKAGFDAEVKRIEANPRTTPEQKEALKNDAQQRFDAGQHHRDQSFRNAKIEYAGKQLANEEGRVAAARRQMDLADAAAQRDAEISKEMEVFLAPHKKALLDARNAARLLPEPSSLELLNPYEKAKRDAARAAANKQVAEEENRLERATTAFNARNPARDPNLAKRAAEARENYKRVQEDAEPKIYNFKKTLGAGRLGRDTAQAVRNEEVISQFRERPETQQAIEHGSKPELVGAMRQNAQLLRQIDTGLDSSSKEMTNALQRIIKTQNEDRQRLRYLELQQARGRKW